MDNNDAARREAERLAAAALAAASFAAKNLSRRLAADARDRDMRDRDMRDRDMRDRELRDRGADRDDRGRGFGGGFGGSLGGLTDDLGMLAGIAGRLFGADDDRRRDSGRSGAPMPGPAPQAEHHHHIATGSDECCLCPICRMISAVRDPSPEFSERIASGASDLAAGVTNVLRAFGTAARRRASAPRATVHGDTEVMQPETRPQSRAAEPDWDEPAVEDEIEILDIDIEAGSFDAESAHAPESEMGKPTAEAHDADALGADAVEAREARADEAEPAVPWGGSSFNSVWQAATRAGTTKPSHNGAPPAKKAVAKKAVAKKAVAKKAVAKKAMANESVADTTAASKRAAGKTVAKKTVAKKTVAKKTAAPKAAGQAAGQKAAGQKAVARKAAAPKTTAKKAVPSKTPPGGSAATKAGPADRS